MHLTLEYPTTFFFFKYELTDAFEETFNLLVSFHYLEKHHYVSKRMRLQKKEENKKDSFVLLH